MTHVKICSVQSLEHALAAADAGADFIGFNFVPGVRRQLPEDEARRMVQEYREQRGERRIPEDFFSGRRLPSVERDAPDAATR